MEAAARLVVNGLLRAEAKICADHVRFWVGFGWAEDLTLLVIC